MRYRKVPGETPEVHSNQSDARVVSEWSESGPQDVIKITIERRDGLSENLKSGCCGSLMVHFNLKDHLSELKPLFKNKTTSLLLAGLAWQFYTYWMSKRQKYKETKNKISVKYNNIVMSGKFCTLTMFFGGNFP